MTKQVWISAVVAVLIFFMGYGIGISNTPLRRAVRTAQNLSARHTLTGKKKALEILDRQNDLVVLAIRKLAVEESRQSIALSLGQEYIQHEMWNEALKYLAIGESLVPGDSRIHYEMGVANASLMYLQTSQIKKDFYYEAAVRHLQVALKTNPKKYDAYYLLGMLYYQRGLKADAFTAFQKILNPFPDDQKALMAVARIYYDRGDLKKTRQIYLRLENLLPSDSSRLKTVIKNLSEVNRELGNE